MYIYEGTQVGLETTSVASQNYLEVSEWNKSFFGVDINKRDQRMHEVT